MTTNQSLAIGGAAGGAVGNGDYVLNSGNLTVGSDGNLSLSIGNNVGSVGVLTINGGTLVSQSAQIGNGGTGTVNQTGGTTTFNQGPGNWFALGGSTNSTSGGVGNGIYNLSGGTMTVNNWLFMGNSNGTGWRNEQRHFQSQWKRILDLELDRRRPRHDWHVSQSGNSTVTVSNRMLIGGVDGEAPAWPRLKAHTT